MRGQARGEGAVAGVGQPGPDVPGRGPREVRRAVQPGQEEGRRRTRARARARGGHAAMAAPAWAAGPATPWRPGRAPGPGASSRAAPASTALQALDWVQLGLASDGAPGRSGPLDKRVSHISVVSGTSKVARMMVRATSDESDTPEVRAEGTWGQLPRDEQQPVLLSPCVARNGGDTSVTLCGWLGVILLSLSLCHCPSIPVGSRSR